MPNAIRYQLVKFGEMYRFKWPCHSDVHLYRIPELLFKCSDCRYRMEPIPILIAWREPLGRPALKTASDTSHDHGPLEAMYLSHGHWLTAWLRKRMVDRHEAADLVQDTFARLCSRARDLELLSEPRAYLTVVAKRLLINRYQRQALEQAYLSSLREKPESYAPSPEERAVVLETLLELDRMLDGLPAKVRRAFLLSQLDGMSYAQIAESLNVSVRTVTRYMSDAYAQCLRLVLSTDQ